jgi:hypothetical protein
MAHELTTEKACEFLVRHLELLGEEMFEKNFVKDGRILCSVFCIIGPNAEELTGLIREWASTSGFKRTC